MSDPVRAIADAVLYEGYILWPYRRSAMKNQQRWTFGGIYPPAHTAQHPDDACELQAQCLLTGDAEGELQLTLRFLQVVQRSVLESRGDELCAVEELTVEGERHLSWEEALEREIELPPVPLHRLAEGLRHPLELPAETNEEELTNCAGLRAGAIRRSWETLAGAIEMGAQELSPRLWMLTAGVRNQTPWRNGPQPQALQPQAPRPQPQAPRPQALRRAMCSAHLLLRSTGACFVSLTDPPASMAEAAARCVNRGTWPVLVGEHGDRHTLLCSPIILEDFPRIAPESPGDLFDGGEIDQLLILNILTLTDEEKAEMRASDPRAQEILERSESLSPEDLMRLHGTIREFGLARQP